MTWIWIAIAAAVVLAVVIGYNGLVRSRNTVTNAWSQIDVQLKRRLDLVPNLVETVRGYATHERATLEAVVEARNKALHTADTPGARAAADNAVTGALRQLFALSESYPDLKANQNFLALQEELTATEGRVAYARQFYNDAVLRYHNRLDSFPLNLIARSGSFGRFEFFTAGPDADRPPSVRF